MLEPHEKEQLDRVEKMVTDVHSKVNEHHGFIQATKWLLGGIGAGFGWLSGKLWSS